MKIMSKLKKKVYLVLKRRTINKSNIAKPPIFSNCTGLNIRAPGAKMKKKLNFTPLIQENQTFSVPKIRSSEFCEATITGSTTELAGEPALLCEYCSIDAGDP